jgi:hypothetical protein
MYVGIIPFDVAPVLLTIVRYQIAMLALLSYCRYESKRRYVQHLCLTPGEQYRQHMQQGGYRP